MSSTAITVIHDLANASSVVYEPGWLDEREAQAMFAELLGRESAFEGGTTLVEGRQVRTPRRCAAFGDAAFCYPDLGGSGPWPPEMGATRDRLADMAAHPFNYALVNWYRDGEDHTGWHADKIDLHQPETSIAIVSLGAPRVLAFRPIGSRQTTVEVKLEHGSLLWMRGDLQLHYEHAVPPDPIITGCRFSVTYRDVIPPR